MIPGHPVSHQSGAGSHALRSFKQGWFFIGFDETGRRYKGEGVIELVGEMADARAVS